MNRSIAGGVGKRMSILWRVFIFLGINSIAVAVPAWQRQLTATAPELISTPPPSRVEMQVSWNGMIDSGKIRIDFAPPDAKKPDSYIVRFSSSSTGAAAVIFPYQGDFWSEIDPRTFRPKFFHAVEVDKRERKTTTVRHLQNRVESLESTKAFKSEILTHKRSAFKFQPVYDIFSAMLVIRSQRLNTGDDLLLALHPFNNPYLLQVNVMGREIHQGRKAIRLIIGMQKIDRDSMKLRPYRKLKRDITLWISDDEHRIPIEFRASAFIGDIRATLTDHRKL